MAEINSTNLIERYRAGERMFDGASLDGANLAYANLAGASLDGANLDGANLAYANLAGASLDGASLDGASLDGASLAYANLAGASLDGASLDGASLDGASLDGARKLNGKRHLFSPSPHGYPFLFLGVEGDEGWFVLAGCRRKTLAEAKAHWGDDKRMDGAISRWFNARVALVEGEVAS